MSKPPLTILTDDDVRTLLHSLTREDIIKLHQSLANSLHYYSSGDTDENNNNCSASFQPGRVTMNRKDKSSTLFMPGSSSDGMGFKVVTLAESKRDSPGLPVDEESTRSSISSMSISHSNSTSSQTASDIPSYPASAPDSTLSGSTAVSNVTTSPAGSLTLLDRQGSPRAFINASEITAFRTALASTLLFAKRQNVHDVVIFGAGKQAYWHARLALLLRGPDIHHLNIINRSFESGVELFKKLFKTEYPVPVSHPKTEMVTPAHTEYARHLKSLLRSASVIFCTTPSTTPLFPHDILTSTEGRRKGRYIAAIGSFKPHMVELHPDIIKQAVAPHHGHHFHKHAKQGGAVVVDSVEACLREAGELVQAGLGGREVVELGELIMLKRDALQRKAERQSGSESSSLSEGVQFGRGDKKKGDADDDGGLVDWLQRGNVIYKSVGMALMDCVVGNDLVRLADAKGIGIKIDNF
ncbi:NAD(P)-binding protein [Microthyrium microscopicum]|uniref:NAD(P)-binding protein n=1 Tax=Microthyrium microscopicum TaxID=703497 RepID=A0A6A6UPV1_9PEZI|nr:NAD(P)-binding protein [Microthyrium microscopicum]